jgi:hypothetical protein
MFHGYTISPRKNKKLNCHDSHTLNMVKKHRLNTRRSNEIRKLKKRYGKTYYKFITDSNKFT